MCIPCHPMEISQRLLFSCHASQEGQVLSRYKPEELIVSGGASLTCSPPAAVIGYIITHTYTLLSNFTGFLCLSACNSLFFSMTFLHKLMMTRNSSGPNSPSLFGTEEKEQMRKVKRGRGTRQDTRISLQQLPAENLTKTVQSHQLLSSTTLSAPLSSSCSLQRA